MKYISVVLIIFIGTSASLMSKPDIEEYMRIRRLLSSRLESVMKRFQPTNDEERCVLHQVRDVIYRPGSIMTWIAFLGYIELFYFIEDQKILLPEQLYTVLNMPYVGRAPYNQEFKILLRAHRRQLLLPRDIAFYRGHLDLVEALRPYHVQMPGEVHNGSATESSRHLDFDRDVIATMPPILLHRSYTVPKLDVLPNVNS